MYRQYITIKKDYYYSDEKTKIEVEADFHKTILKENGSYELIPESIGWWREYTGSSTTHSYKCAGQLIKLVNEMEALRMAETSNAIYPLVLSFGVNRIDNLYRSAIKSKDRA